MSSTTSVKPLNWSVRNPAKKEIRISGKTRCMDEPEKNIFFLLRVGPCGVFLSVFLVFCDCFGLYPVWMGPEPGRSTPFFVAKTGKP